MRRLLHVIFALSFTFFMALPAQAEQSAMALLERMSIATKQLNYDGIFTYQSGKRIQAIRIIHKWNHNGEVERLLSLNGAARELIRTDDIVTCIFPEGKQVNINRRPLGRGFPSDLLKGLNSASTYYKVTLGKEGRVANRKARQLIVSPVDNFRYGYNLWVDEESALLLQSDLLTEDGMILEQFAFSSITLDLHIPDEQLAPHMTGHQMSWNRIETVNPEDIEEKDSTWDINWLPKGFELVAHQHRRVSNNKQLVEQSVYSDGLTSVSVFVEKSMHKKRHLNGLSTMGAVNAYGRVVNDYFVTVVGQAPRHTIEKIGQSIQVTSHD